MPVSINSVTANPSVISENDVGGVLGTAGDGTFFITIQFGIGPKGAPGPMMPPAPTSSQ